MRRANRKRVVLPKKKPVSSKRGTKIRVSKQNSIYHTLAHRGDHLKICVIRSLGGIGDILMTMPAVRQIKQDFPNSHLVYATDRHSTNDYYELIKNAPFIDEIADARYIDKAEFDAWVDITSVCIKYENAGLPPLNRIDIFARACGIPRLKNPLPFYRIEHSEREWAKSTLQKLNLPDKKFVYLHTASFDRKRCWPPARYIELIKAAQEYPDIHFLISDFNNVLPDRQKYPNCTDVTSASIRHVAALIEQADLFVGPDSGPMHLAGAVGTSSLVLFGSIPPQARLNYYPTHEAIRAEPFPACGGPCWYKACQINTRCMTDITGIQVLKRIQEKLNAKD